MSTREIMEEMLSRSSTGSRIHGGDLGRVIGDGGITYGLGLEISVNVCLSSPPCRVAAACSRSQLPHYLSFSRSVLIVKKVYQTHHVKYRAQIALVPHPPKNLSNKMRARLVVNAKRPYLLTRIACNVRMRDFLFVALHNR